jgi:hypothetical protein
MILLRVLSLLRAEMVLFEVVDLRRWPTERTEELTTWSQPVPTVHRNRAKIASRTFIADEQRAGQLGECHGVLSEQLVVNNQH